MCATLIRLCTFVVLVFTSFASWSAIEIHEFDNEIDRLRYQSFIDEMRCPKCQNQNLAGTNSPIAEDLRRELVSMIKEGKSDKEIVDFMVERYGEFILYRPRLSPATLFLWLAPIVLLIAGAGLLFLIVRKRRRIEVELGNGLSRVEQERLASLLNSTPNEAAIHNKSKPENK